MTEVRRFLVILSPQAKNPRAKRPFMNEVIRLRRIGFAGGSFAAALDDRLEWSSSFTAAFCTLPSAHVVVSVNIWATRR